MGALDGFEVMEKVPIPAKRSVWNSREVVRAFIESGNDCMGKRFADNREAKNAYMAYYMHIRRFGLPVILVMRKNMVILIREDAV